MVDIDKSFANQTKKTVKICHFTGGGKFLMEIAIIKIFEPPAFREYSIYQIFEALCICIFLCLCVGHCHHQMISFQEIKGLYDLKRHTSGENQDITIVVHMDGRTDRRQIEFWTNLQ